MEQNELIKRFAEIQGITYEEAQAMVDAPTGKEILENIERITLEKIKAKTAVPLNRAQRRALAKKTHSKNKNDTSEIIAETAKKLEYIDLIQKLRALNEKNAKENKENEETD